jgi:hypothetical protein
MSEQSISPRDGKGRAWFRVSYHDKDWAELEELLVEDLSVGEVLVNLIAWLQAMEYAGVPNVGVPEELKDAMALTVEVYRG